MKYYAVEIEFDDDQKDRKAFEQIDRAERLFLDVFLSMEENHYVRKKTDRKYVVSCRLLEVLADELRQAA